MNLLSRLLAALILVISAVAARADLFSFNFAGNGQNGSGFLTANLTSTAGPYQITSISGTLTGVAIAGLLPRASFGGNNNLLFATGTNFLPDGSGFSFSLTNGILANLFTFSGVPFDGQQFLARSDGTLAAMTTFQITPVPVPEPASYALLGTGLAGLAQVVRGRRSRLG